MFCVVTVRYLNCGTGRKRIVSRGPLHPSENWAIQWAEYLRNVGLFHDVRVENSKSTNATRNLVGLNP